MKRHPYSYGPASKGSKARYHRNPSRSHWPSTLETLNLITRDTLVSWALSTAIPTKAIQCLSDSFTLARSKTGEPDAISSRYGGVKMNRYDAGASWVDPGKPVQGEILPPVSTSLIEMCTTYVDRAKGFQVARWPSQTRPRWWMYESDAAAC
jgi:hypothetical protein